jgi:ADP-heptose:LPS heptosyltransferase
MPKLRRRDQNRTTLVYHSGALGDFITTLPAIRLWKKNYPSDRMVLLGRESSRKPAMLSRLFDDFWDMDRVPFPSLFSNTVSHEIESLLSELDTAILFANCRSPLCKNFHKIDIKQLYVQAPFPDSRKPKYLYHLSLFESLPVQTIDPAPLLHPPGHPLPDDVGELLPPSSSPGVIIHPGSGSSIKNWPLERFVQLAERLEDDGCSILWISGPAEADLNVPISHPRVQNREVSDLIYLLSRCELYIGNDSGISHCAAALNKPCVVLFGPSDPVVWRPFGSDVHILYKQPVCGPCHTVQHPIAEKKELACSRDCLSSIAIKEVYRVCRLLLR